MRVIPQITAEIATMFGLDPSQQAQAGLLLAMMGRDSLEAQSQTALDGCESVADAACWAALHAPYPWPWLAAELHEKIESRSEDFKGRKLFCALILRRGSGCVDDAIAPKGLSEALEELGSCCADTMTCPSEALRMSAHRRLGLAEALDAGEPHILPAHPAPPVLGAWALPILYRPSRHGSHKSMDDRSKSLLAASMADIVSSALSSDLADDGSPSSVLLGIGPWSAILSRAPSLCAPITLRAKIIELSSVLRISPEQIAVSVSQHRQDGANWMRIAIRPQASGLCLDGLDWPAGPEGLDAEFGRLLNTLSSSGIEWCYQVEGIFDAMACPHCDKPVYPAPENKDWAQSAIDAGTPPDGSHAH